MEKSSHYNFSLTKTLTPRQTPKHLRIPKHPKIFKHSKTPMIRYNLLLDGLLLSIILYHLVVSPYTKVEESFNIQAIHDIINFGVVPPTTVYEHYDHIEFPGPIPRTFVGSLVIGMPLRAVLTVLGLVGIDIPGILAGSQFQFQVLVRIGLGLINGVMLIKIRDSVNGIVASDKVSTRKGSVGFWYMVLLVTQFHLLYYASRTLPNFMALPLVSYAIGKLVRGDSTGITWLAITGVVFRAEVGVLACSVAFVSSIVFGQTSIGRNISLLLVGTLLGSAVTVLVDSYFWGQWVFPEVNSVIFNVFEGNSANWGTEPWGFYFSSYLPQLFRPPIILMLLPLGLLSDPAQVAIASNNGDDLKSDNPPQVSKAKNSLNILFFASILYIVIMSFQPHKEWRFIIYVAPIFTLQAAIGMSNLAMKWSLSFAYKLTILVVCFLTITSFVLSLSIGYISSFNYPGGDAITFANEYALQTRANSSTLIHMDIPSCMLGITRFNELHYKPVSYDKTELKGDLLKLWKEIDVLISSINMKNLKGYDNATKILFDPSNWKLLHISYKMQGVSLVPLFEMMRNQKNDSGYLLRFILKILEELNSGKFTTIKGFLRGFVVNSDYIFVYERIRTGDDYDSKIFELAKQFINDGSTDESFVSAV